MTQKAFLCVDDEKVVLDSLKSQIKRRFGSCYKCEIATCADEALEIIEELHSEGIKIVIIVTDWLMPGIRGDEFLISVHKKFPGIVKLMLTGYAEESAIENARTNADLFACIHKPWKEEELYDTLDAALKEAES